MAVVAAIGVSSHTLAIDRFCATGQATCGSFMQTVRVCFEIVDARAGSVDYSSDLNGISISRAALVTATAGTCPGASMCGGTAGCTTADVVEICNNDCPSPFQGSITLTPSQIANLQAGTYFVEFDVTDGQAVCTLGCNLCCKDIASAPSLSKSGEIALILLVGVTSFFVLRRRST